MNITTMLTEQDVRDADFAFTLRRQARDEGTTTESLIREFFDYDIDGMTECYRHGSQLLRDYIVLTSDRSIVGGRFDAETEARVVSPIVQMQSGHIATSAAYRAVALAQR